MLSIGSEDMQKAEKKISKYLEGIKRIKTRDKRGATSLMCAEVEVFYRSIVNDSFIGIVNTYNYGFMRGVNYQRAQQQKRGKGANNDR